MNTTLEALMQGANYTSTPPAPSPLDASLPADLQAFYRKYGQTTFYPGAPYSFTIQQADQLERADLHVAGEDIGDELSEYWYVIATCDDQAISIDLRPGETFGHCYDSFWDRYPTADDTTLVARSFTELLQKIVADSGRSLFWIDGHH